MHRVLVIDDNAAFRESVGLCLGERGFRVEAAGSAEEGLRAACGGPPRLILLDLRLPDGSGLTVLRELQRREVFAPVVDLEYPFWVEDYLFLILEHPLRLAVLVYRGQVVHVPYP